MNEKIPILTDFSFIITKASYDAKTGERRWMATTSDTGMDLRNQRMSLELFNDFIRRAKTSQQIPVEFQSEYFKGGMPYVSVSHYPDFDGQGSVGETKELYVDGNRLKAKGIFNNTPLGIKAFEAISKSIHDKESNPIRISIGFLDWKHTHGNSVFTRKSLYDLCPICTKTKENVVFLSGQLIHLALTRVPVNQRTIIEAEVEKSMTTRKEDAESIVGKDEAEKLENLAHTQAEQSEAMVEKSEEKIIPETVPSPAPVIEEAEVIPEGMPTTFTEDWATFKLPDEEKVLFDAEQEAIVENATARKDVTPADKKAAEKKYGDVKYADETNKKYPIDTEEHIRAAWNYIHQGKNAAKYSPEEVKTIKSKIESAWKSVIGGTPPAAEKKSETELVVEKQMDSPVPVVVVDEPAQYLPFAGATSWKDAQDWIDTQKEEGQFQDAWYLFQSISDNIMKSENDELPDKAKALKALMGDFQKNITMKSFAILSKVEEKLLSEPTPIEVHPLDGVMDELKSLYTDTVSQKITEEEKLQKLQPAFENFALVIRSLVKETPKGEFVESLKPSAEIVEMKTMIESLQTGMKSIVDNVQLLMQTKSGAVARPAVPAPRNLVPTNLVKKADTSLTPKLDAIIRKSVGII